MTLTPLERQKLFQTLTAIAPEQLEVIIFTLSPPAGIIPPMPASQGNRVSALLNWAGSPSGCGLVTVQQILDEVITPSLSEIAQGVQTEKEQEQEESKAQYDQRGATIYGFAPNSTGSNVISGQKITGNTIIGTQNNYSNQNLNQSTISGDNEEVISLWKEKLASYQKEEAIASDPEKKFQLKQLIKACQQKIKDLGG